MKPQRPPGIVEFVWSPASVVPRRRVVAGNLAVSRGLADFTYKKDADKGPGDQKISCVRERLAPRSAKCTRSGSGSGACVVLS